MTPKHSGSQDGNFDIEPDSTVASEVRVQTESKLPDHKLENVPVPIDQENLQNQEQALEAKEPETSDDDPNDRNIVSWDSPSDPANPKNWSFRRKWAAVYVVSCFTFISPCSSSMVSPGIETISRDLHITRTAEGQMTMSAFVLAYAFGPLFLGPLSEIYGRVPVLQLANLVYLVFNLAGGASRTKGQLIAFRFLSGLGGSAPLSVSGGVISDLFTADQRGRAVSLYALMPLLAPAVGPIAGGFITEYSSWRWAFYATSIADAVVQVIGLFFLQETYAPVLLARKKKQLQKTTGNENLLTEYEAKDPSSRSLLSLWRTSLSRPFIMLATQPIIQLLTLYRAYQYGLTYLMLSTMPVMYARVYHQSEGITGLQFISVAIGLCFGVMSLPLLDKLYKRNGKGYRVPLMIPCSLIIPIGLLWYGWSASASPPLHWIMPDIGIAIMSMGIAVSNQCLQAYLIDSYQRYAASASGSVVFLRSLAGFAFPLFAPRMFDTLGYGKGCTVLACASIAIGIPAPILLWFWGAKIRARSKFAAG
ncbi:MFS multidrug transporter [Xylona heveae TC161]|uniref:MFS multidrug transporter n=1 Tax=Xylona heveae (strain CBS 132557 / TC161) TaxID=1328760 RepID=A0A165AC49_XYLHT|nr:MFS multidrug transporter [Xylona heveae TC161]KZF20237.1 MFS multidrug transporter [Xylona heveae TC161]